jgi:RNA polymerase sigma-70 factor (ECF subfamily)
MEESIRQKIAGLLGASDRDADPRSADALFPVVYRELRAMARGYFRKERPGHTLQPTALVHEAYLRLVDESLVGCAGRTHFRVVCARVMRRVLIDYARARGRVRRGGPKKPMPLETDLAALDVESADPVELNNALERLAALDPRQAQVVELRFFGGLTADEVATVLGVSKRSVEGDWTHAKAWLRAELGRESSR